MDACANRSLGDFCQISYPLTCLDTRLLCRTSSLIARLCSCRCSLKANLNPAPSGTRFSGNRLIAAVVRRLALACAVRAALAHGGATPETVGTRRNNRSACTGSPW